MDIFAHYFPAILICFFLIGFILFSNNFEIKINRNFYCATISLFLLIEADIVIDAYNNEFMDNMIAVLFVAFSDSLCSLTILFIILISRRNASLREKALLFIPQIINTLVALSALFVPWAFKVKADGEIVRGIIGFTPYVVSIFYLVTFGVFAFFEFRHGNIEEGYTIVLIILGAFVAILFRILTDQEYVLCNSIAICIAFYYIMFHAGRNNRDELTGCYVLRRFYIDATNYSKKISSIISFDINDLKNINDLGGHYAGDIAIRSVVNAVVPLIGNKRKLYRMGGDEFAIICYKDNKEMVEQLCHLINQAVKESGYSIAIGYCMREEKFDIISMMKTADEKMYENKKSMKK